MKRKPNISKVRELLSYDPSTGELRWKPRIPGMFSDDRAMTAAQRCAWWNTRFAGKEAFTAKNTYGHPQGTIWGHQMAAHAVCWAIHHGKWPRHEIDHIDGNPTNNRISNLRDTKLNHRNKKLDKRNLSGVSGVSFEKGRWRARIGTDENKWASLGSFPTKEQAIAARRKAEKENGYTGRS